MEIKTGTITENVHTSVSQRVEYYTETPKTPNLSTKTATSKK